MCVANVRPLVQLTLVYTTRALMLQLEKGQGKQQKFESIWSRGSWARAPLDTCRLVRAH